MTYKNVNICNNTQMILDKFLAIREAKTGIPSPSKSNALQKDTLETHLKAKSSKHDNIKQNTNLINTSKDGNDDGKIPFKEKIVNFGKGIVTPIKTMFSSPKNIAITAASVAAGAALVALTGGAAAPVMVAAGIIGGGVQVGKGISKQINAKTDEEARQAWQQMGSGTFTVGVSAAGAKASVKAANGAETGNMSTISAIVKCFKDAPKNIMNSVTNAGQKLSGFVNSAASSSSSAVSGGKGRVYTDADIIDVDFVEVVDDGAAVQNKSFFSGIKSKLLGKGKKSDTLQLGTSKKDYKKLTSKPE
ncbi:MAG: hypothetical protein LUH05_03355, partial [Candidatus Gastranaerophilales bacterium]|nr:hypothetical protein [Candidatus Gastranaerophilales bacterium]